MCARVVLVMDCDDNVCLLTYLSCLTSDGRRLERQHQFQVAECAVEHDDLLQYVGPNK